MLVYAINLDLANIFVFLLGVLESIRTNSFNNSYEGYFTCGEALVIDDRSGAPRTGRQSGDEPRFPPGRPSWTPGREQVAMDDPSEPGPGVRGPPSRTVAETSGSRETGVVFTSEGDIDAARERIVGFIGETVDAAGAEGVVVNTRGAVDSTVTAALAVEALGPERVYGLILPCNKLGEPSARDAETLAGALDIEHDTVHLRPLFAQFGAAVDDQFGVHDDPISAEALIARLRTALTYLAADSRDALVCGATNRSDRLLGTVVEDGGSDAELSPISHLYRTDIRAMAELLDVPEFVTDGPRGVGRPPGYVDGPEIADESIDRVLHLYVDEGLDSDGIAAETGVDREVVSALCARYDRAERERRLPRRLAPHGAR